MDENQLRAEAAKIAAEWHAGGMSGGSIYEDFAVELAKRAVAAERERGAAKLAQAEYLIAAWERGALATDYYRDIADFRA